MFNPQEIKARIARIEEDTKLNNSIVSGYKKQLICEHEFTVTEGDNISTTGPTGLYEGCNKCGYNREVGYVGTHGQIFYAEEKIKREKAFKKAREAGLSDEDIRYLKTI